MNKLIALLKRLVRLLLKLWSLSQDYVKDNIFQIKRKPKVINLNANDICNSKCVMCNIWKQKKEFEFNGEELKSILRNPLYDEVAHVGITGGEPTLRKDLAELYDAVLDTLPNLKGVSIITNAIQIKQVKARLDEVSQVCKKYQIPFSVMISLDGTDDVHDKVRGRKGNFKSVIEILNYVQNELKLPVSVGCTITKSNVWNVDELLDFVKEKGIVARFRIAEFIDRLYNEKNVEEIRSFDALEVYHLQCFFQKLIFDFEESLDVQRTYQSIIHQLGGGKREIGCPYKTEGIVLGSNGDLRYCAPKSPAIGNAIEGNSLEIYNENVSVRNEILKDNCKDCIHDYHAKITLKEQIKIYKDFGWDQLIRIKKLNNFWLTIPRLSWSLIGRKKTFKRVLIVGWYGTETTGDKAILGGVMDYYIKKYPNARFTIASIYPYITRQTLSELAVEAQIVKSISFDMLKEAARADLVVMGGGPLMDIEALSIPLWSFRIARFFGRETILHGVGIGPLNKQVYETAVIRLLQLSKQILLRDSKSVIKAHSWGFKNAEQIEDPAIPYIERLPKTKTEKGEKTISCFLREWPTEYSGGLSLQKYNELKTEFEKRLAEILKSVSKSTGLKLNFYPMHTFVVGADDRDFYRRFTKQYFKDFEFTIFDRPTSVQSTLDVMNNSHMNICMRYHSTVFAHGIKSNFYAIDYTNGGKVSSFMTDSGKDNFICLDEILKTPQSKIVNEILQQVNEIKVI